MEVEKIHQLYATLDPKNIALGKQLALGYRMGMTTVADFWNRMLTDSVFSRVPQWEKHFETHSFLGYDQMVESLRQEFLLWDKEVAEIKNYDIHWIFFQGMNIGDSHEGFRFPFQDKQYTLHQLQIKGSLIDVYRKIYEIEQRVKDRQHRIDDRFNCFEVNMYVPDWQKGLSKPAFEALKKRLLAPANAPCDDCATRQADNCEDAYRIPTCRNRRLWLNDVRFMLCSDWSEVRNDYIEIIPFAGEYESFYMELMKVSPHNIILAKDLLGIAPYNIRYDEDGLYFDFYDTVIYDALIFAVNPS